MFLDFEENRPDTPRVVPALTRLERILLVIVGYQLILLSYFLAPDSWFQPVKQLIAPDEPVRFVQIQPLTERPAIAKAAPAVVDRQPAAPQPTPSPQPDEALLRANGPDRSLGPPNEPPRPSDIPRPTSPTANESPIARTLAPGGILGSARKNLDRVTTNASETNQTAGFDEQGPAIQFDDRGVDFGPWLRRFRVQVIRNWFIPQTAEVMRGHVVIQMRVLRDGTLANIRVVQSSGIEPFDRAAMTALRLSTPTLQLPDAYPLGAIDPFTVIFYYNEPVR